MTSAISSTSPIAQAAMSCGSSTEQRSPAEGAGYWESVMRRALNPKVPTLDEAMRELLTPEEIKRYTALRAAIRGARKTAADFGH